MYMFVFLFFFFLPTKMIEALLYYCAGYAVCALIEKCSGLCIQYYWVCINVGGLLFPCFLWHGLVLKKKILWSQQYSVYISLFRWLSNVWHTLVSIVMMYSDDVEKGEHLFLFFSNIPIQGNTIVPVKIFYKC